MSSHSGTLGRARGLTIGEQLRRQLSVEWQRDRGYSSSDDDERFVPSIDTTLLASLIAQNQFSTNEVAYRSDCDINELGAREIPPSATNPFPILEQTTNAHNGSSNTIQTNVSPLQLRQGSPFPMDSGNRRLHFNTQERMRSNSNINGDSMFSSRSGLSDLNGSKSHIMPNNSLLRTNRSVSNRHNRSSGMTSSSSATSSNSNNNITDRERDNSCRDLESRSNQRIKDFNSDDTKLDLRDTLRLNLEKPNDEPPPEPAPPEVPPRGQSLHATSFHRLDHQLKIEKNGDQTHEHFIPQEQQHEYLMSGSPRTTGYPARSPLTTSTSSGQQNQQQRKH